MLICLCGYKFYDGINHPVRYKVKCIFQLDFVNCLEQTGINSYCNSLNAAYCRTFLESPYIFLHYQLQNLDNTRKTLVTPLNL